MDRQATSETPRLFLIGPMGAGKSSIGRRLARRFKLDFVDSDRAIEARTGVDIPRIFDIEGEAGFRRREAAMIDELTQRRGVVLATGGGAVLAAANRDRLSQRGTVVYLRTSVDTQLARTAHSDRPLLRGTDRRARLEALAAVRNALYEAAADIIVDTDRGTMTSVVDEIVRRLGAQRLEQ